MPSLTVLVVDDEPANQEIAMVLLRSMGHQVQVACDGAHALALCRDAEAPYDLILMDVFMPQMDGLQATSLLRADARYRTIPIICVSALPDRLTQEAALEAGCNLFIPKPYKKATLVQAIGRVMRV